jgi:heme exporter protein D
MSDLDPTHAPSERPTAPADRVVDAPSVRRTWSRSLVHVALLLTAAGALATLTILYIRNAIHADIGLAFVALVIVHLLQRRRTVARMASQLARARSFAERKFRLAGSDLLLAFITLNVLVSGILDWSRGQPVQIPLPRPFDRWHFLSGVALVLYLVVHVWHRRKRLRGSVIR